MNEKVLVIDDDVELLSLLQVGLEREGFVVVIARNGKQGLRRAYETHPDVIVLDIAMPEMDGWIACQRLRSICDTPIIVLTAKTDQVDVLKGLSLGADDYLTKPCRVAELRARIRAVLDRTSAGLSDNWRVIYEDDDLYIDLKDGAVRRRGEEVHLTPIETRLLMYLVAQSGRIVPHEELLANVWGQGYAEEANYLSVYVRYLRRKIEDDPSNPRYVRTRWRMGYYFEGKGEFRSDKEEHGDSSN